MCEPLFALRVSDPQVAYPIRSRPSRPCACPIRTVGNLFLFATELHAGHSRKRGTSVVGDEGAHSSRSSRRSRRRGAGRAERLSVRLTASSWRKVTTGLPSAMHSIANRPYQPALSWSTTMSARGTARTPRRGGALRRSRGRRRALDGGDHVLGALRAATRARADHGAPGRTAGRA